jgi:AAA+ superfamily predicted ATPase
MQEIVNDSQCRSQLAQSLFDFGFELKNNDDKELVLSKFNKLQKALQQYIHTASFQQLKTRFKLTDLELKILAISLINAVEPETVSVFLQLSWFENGPGLTLERMFLLSYQGHEGKYEQFSQFIKRSSALAWGLIQSDRSHLALIQSVTIPDDIFSFLLGDTSPSIKDPEHIVALNLMDGPSIVEGYAGVMNQPVGCVNLVGGLTLNERTLFVSQLAICNGCSCYRFFTQSEENVSVEKLLSELRCLIIQHKDRSCYLYWPNLLDHCAKQPDVRQVIKLLSEQNNVKLFFDDEDSQRFDVAENSLALSCLPERRSWLNFHLRAPSQEQLNLAWQAFSKSLSQKSKGNIEPLSLNESKLLSLLYPMLPGKIHGIYIDLTQLDLTEESINLYQYCQKQCLELNSQSMGDLAKVCQPRYTLDNMVLMKSAKEKLSELIQRIQFSEELTQVLPNFVPGLKALFWGKPGTGKSMAAESIAGQLRLPLYKINLANIASKWIGETEKHLAQVFDKAQKQNAVLLFDEADAIFSKRSEIESSHDKNANMGVSFLLQRMETYTGLLLLSTNFKSNLDEAFLRRFHSLVEFPMPDLEARKQLWGKAWSGRIHLESNINMADLAGLHEFSPSQISNIAERAVLLGLMKGISRISKSVLATAIARELEKQDENYLASKKLKAWLEH